MKILLLAPHPFFTDRGTPIAVRALAEHLGAGGHRIDLLTFHQGRDVEIPGCRLHRIPKVVWGGEIRPGFSVRKLICDAAMGIKALRMVRREGYDLVHAVEEAAFLARGLKLLFGTPYVYDMDSSLAQQMVEKYPGLRLVSGALEAFEGHAVRNATAVLAVCQALVDTARGHAPEKLVGKLEDVSLLEDAPGATESLRRTIGADGPIVMYVGNLERYQGIDLLVEGFALTRTPARLVVIGGAEGDIAFYRQRARELDISDRAHFLGPRPIAHLAHYLRQATVLASPRIKGTNTAMKVYSYLDSGVPVLATRLLTHTQVLDDEIAKLVEPDPRAFAAGLDELLADEPLRRRLAAAAAERVRREYSPEAFGRKLEAFYGRVAALL